MFLLHYLILVLTACYNMGSQTSESSCYNMNLMCFYYQRLIAFFWMIILLLPWDPVTCPHLAQGHVTVRVADQIGGGLETGCRIWTGAGGAADAMSSTGWSFKDRLNIVEAKVPVENRLVKFS